MAELKWKMEEEKGEPPIASFKLEKSHHSQEWEWFPVQQRAGERREEWSEPRKGSRGSEKTDPAPQALLLLSVIQSCPTLCDPWTVACQAPLSMGFPRQQYWSGLPFPSPGLQTSKIRQEEIANIHTVFMEMKIKEKIPCGLIHQQVKLFFFSPNPLS